MEYTQNYALRKPGLNEYANVGDLNYNSDKIDSQMKKNQDVDGEVYDPTSTSANAYEAGDYVINPDDGLMYVCNGTTYGTWDATKWDHTTEFEEIQKAMASGGESELADLHDVDITNPTDGQALLYDPTSSKWHNSDLPDADVTKEASGNPIEFEDGASAPLVKCVTQITGSQDLHGYDKPWVGGAGSNKCDEEWELGDFDVHGNPVSSSTIIRTKNFISVTPGYEYHLCTAGKGMYIVGYDANKENGGYLFNTQPKTDTNITIPDGVYFIKANMATAYGATYNHDLAINYPSTVTTYSPYSNICPITAYTEGEISVGARNLWDSSLCTFAYMTLDGTIYKNTNTDTAAQFDPYISIYNGTTLFFNSKNFTKIDNIYSMAINITYDFSLIVIRHNGSSRDLVIRFPYSTKGEYVISFKVLSNNIQTVGGLQITNIQLERGETPHAYEPYVAPTTHTTTYPSAIYRGSEDVVNGEVESNMECDTLTTTIGGYVDPVTGLYIGVIKEGVKPYSDSAVSTVKCDKLETTASGYQYNNSGNFIVVTPTGKICVTVVGCTTATLLNDWLSNNSLQVAYELATPTTSSVTPTNLPIKSLSGYNHIESSTGEMEVEYIAKAFSPIMEIVDSQISALSKMMELMLTSARETTMTASANYTTGTLIVACGALYKATTAISSGASLVVGTNITPTTIAEELAALA